jgi:NAD(P)-dependent dehydrogenase (short-subunit alcohol dehydrogenase family)
VSSALSARLSGKRALVTGGASGIGEAIVRRFLDEGASVIVGDVDEEARERVEKAGAVFGVCDVSQPEHLEELVAGGRDAFGGLDIAVANAGYELLGDVLELSYEDWDRHQSVMLRGVFATFRSVLPMMVQQGSGALIGVASQLAFVALPRFTSYLAAKAAVVGLVRGVALDFAGRGIRVNALCPGPTLTPLIERQLIGVEDSEALLAEWASDTMMNRLGRPQEIAAAAAFLASDDASFMTGAALVVDGGFIAK